MKFYNINPQSNYDEIAKSIGTSSSGIKIMSDKANIKFILIKNINSPAANILKQDALSVGADLLTHNDTILGTKDLHDALLMATPAQLKKLSKKEKMQDFGLKDLSNFLLKQKMHTKNQKPQIMGVINVNEDSFNPSSRVNQNQAIKKIESMIEEGASYIDIGAVSSRPGSTYVGSEVEFKRLKVILDEIYRLNLYNKTKFSLDSFDPKCLQYSLDRGFKMINDITADTNLAHIAAKYNAELCIMHMQGNTKNMQDNPQYKDLIGQIYDFLHEKAIKASDAGVKNIVLDVGIGFGKKPKDNILLIKHLNHFKTIGHKILIGASRKSVINEYYPSDVSQRLSGTLYLHLQAAKNGADIIRVHDVAEHTQLFALNEAYENINLW